ncbi:adenosine transporter 2, putative [Trypanosoma brucei gambiense DAL972]|uniref:Adenosine transporter 2, putative n=1 Tax=Trypanosoma brucei gambiense (strain MHOM/CI/86/DAL972) TaxID=679716 RepID=C9ZJU5_TRYB9|nr:LOW QUALITY PROTEIN: adenosine transporter 2, putative [Trypanosoma brucei gambiense DAL972]CBH09655.1 adenosine transporter 2, putative [Trypanosoma brucei gambiense DAL972]|eukprot:XP_011771959.1 LOW QUALITY PROTEIN: adenosine transporter 2, putative [Trypanosoma brucei gambiense DAL972]
MAMLGFESTAEFFVYLTFIFFGMSVMNVTNAIYSNYYFFWEYYKFAQGNEHAVSANPSFWKHMFTYYNVVVFTMQVLLEAFMLTPLGRQIPISWRLIFGLTIPMVEIIVILVIPAVGGTSEGGAMATMMIVAFVCGISMTLCDSSNAALAGPFPTKFYGAIVWGLAVSGLMTSFLAIVIKASMDSSFESKRVQSQIYFGLVMFLQVVACVLLVLLRKNPYAIKYAAEFRYAARKKGTVCDFDVKGTGPVSGNRYADEKENKNVLNADIDPDKMKDTDQVEGTTNAQQILTRVLMVVVKRIWPMLLSCFFVFFATLLVFPGVFIAAKTGDTSGWYFTVVVAMFNLGDFLSRLVLQFKQLHVSPRMVMIGSFARALLIIPLSLCAAGTIPGVWLPYIVSLLWGLTNGYFGGLSMIYGPRTGSLTTAGQRSLAAICINVALLMGLFAGAMFALAVKEGLPE